MTKLEKTTHIFLIAVCIVSLVVLVKRGLLGPSGPSNGAPQSESSVVGKKEASVPTAAWKASRRNVVMVLSSQCHYCAASIPLYRQLSSLRRQRGSGLSLLVVGREDPRSLRDFLTRNGVATDNVLQLPAGFVGVDFTPALFIVDSNGVVQKAFFGKLDSSREAKLLDVLGV